MCLFVRLFVFFLFLLYFLLSSMHFIGEFNLWTYTFPIQCDAEITYAVRLNTCNKTPPQKCLYWYNLLDLLNSRYWIDTAKLNVTSEIEFLMKSHTSSSSSSFCLFSFFFLGFFIYECFYIFFMYRKITILI